MRICTIRHTDVLLNPLLIIVVAGACVLGRLYDLLQAVFALTLHELAHAAAARAFGCRIRAMELAPYGAALRLSDTALSPHAEWCVASAGPLCSFLVAGAAASVLCLFPATGVRMRAFLTFNLLLGLINLLPALPLDGGRIVKCALAPRLGDDRAARATALSGVCIAAAMLAGAVFAAVNGIYNLTLPVMGVFLLIASLRELRAAPERRLAALAKRNDLLRSGEAVDVHLIAANTTMYGVYALRLMRTNAYTILRVVDDGMRFVGELDEAVIITNIARYGMNITVGEMLINELHTT